MWLRSGVAVAVAEASGCSSDSTPGLGTSICHGCGPKKKIKTKIKLKNKSRRLCQLLMTTEFIHFVLWRRMSEMICSGRLDYILLPWCHH